MLNLDKYTYSTINLALFSCYTMGFGDVESETGYPKEQFETLDKKYDGFQNYQIDEKDLPIIIKALEWMLVIRDESELLDISHEQGLKLLDLLRHQKADIKITDWSDIKVENLPGKEYHGDTKKGNVFIKTDKGESTVFPNSDPSEYIRKSSSKDLSLREGS